MNFFQRGGVENFGILSIGNAGFPLQKSYFKCKITSFFFDCGAISKGAIIFDAKNIDFFACGASPTHSSSAQMVYAFSWSFIILKLLPIIFYSQNDDFSNVVYKTCFLVLSIALYS